MSEPKDRPLTSAELQARLVAAGFYAGMGPFEDEPPVDIGLGPGILRPCAVINLSRPDVMRECIANGLVWSGPPGARAEAARLIANQEVPPPDPATIPEAWAAYILALVDK